MMPQRRSKKMAVEGDSQLGTRSWRQDQSHVEGSGRGPPIPASSK